MKLTVVPIIVGAHGTVHKHLELEIRGSIETIAVLRSGRVLRRVLDM